MCLTAHIKKLFLFTFLISVFELSSFAEENVSGEERFAGNEQGLVDENPLISDIEIKQLLSRSFSKNFSKYHFSKRQKIEHSCRVIIPIGLGVGLVLISGPGAAIPILVGVGYGIKARLDYVRNKKARSLFKGSLLHLLDVDRSQSPSRNRKRLDVFNKFFNGVKNELRDYLDKEVSDEELKKYLAYQLLIINRYGPLIIERYKNVKGTAWWKEPVTEVFSERFLKNKLIVLIDDCSNHLVKTMRFNHLDKMVGS